MKPGWNPTRRNRNIGTKASGHGENNRLVIPESIRSSKYYFERLKNYRHLTRQIGDREISFYIEPTRPDWFYPCTIDDVAHALSFCSERELHAFDFIVMRRPTRKQRILCPVWGRAIFQFDLEERSGAAIVLEAQCLETISWQVSLDPERKRELLRLEADGHRIVRTRRAILIKPSLASLRATTLYRTLFHELGHHIDFNRSSYEEWNGKTKSVKEDFAHRFAHETAAYLFEHARLPFAALLDESTLEKEGLPRNWFTPD